MFSSVRQVDDYVDFDKFKANEEHYDRDIKFNWSEDDPESMKRLCPGLFERFMNSA